eukprot:SM001689S02989  [mRNA]  locus=s1689:54:2018:+ [translate_table: standard]
MTVFSNLGIVPGYAAHTRFNTMLFMDRQDITKTNVTTFTNSSAYAHAVEFNILGNFSRGLNGPNENYLGAAGHTSSDGTVIVAGGWSATSTSFYAMRAFQPTPNRTGDFNYPSLTPMLGKRFAPAVARTATGNILIVGGSGSAADNDTVSQHAATYEYMIKATGEKTKPLPLLASNMSLPFDLYPILHLLTNGNFFFFTGIMSCEINFTASGNCVRTFPNFTSPDGTLVSRSHPYQASSVLLPLSSATNWTQQIMICGGGLPTSQYCGTITMEDADPQWVWELMPGPRVLSSAVLLPTGKIVLINGATSGSGFTRVVNPPLLKPYIFDANKAVGNTTGRWVTGAPATTPRLFQSVASLAFDGRILVAGSNPSSTNNQASYTSGTPLSLDAYLPPYYFSTLGRPLVYGLLSPLAGGVQYGGELSLNIYSPGASTGAVALSATLVDPGFNTHGLTMGQRAVLLDQTSLVRVGRNKVSGNLTVSFSAPSGPGVAPPGWYMLFVIAKPTSSPDGSLDGVPSEAIW